MTMTVKDVRVLVAGELLVKFETSFYLEQVEVVFKFIEVE